MDWAGEFFQGDESRVTLFFDIKDGVTTSQQIVKATLQGSSK